MGISHSKHHQYYEERNRIHGYQKANSRRARSATATAPTHQISTYSNNKYSTNKDGNKQRKKPFKTVVYYPNDYFETVNQNPLQNGKNNGLRFSGQTKKTRSQGRLPINSNEQIAFNSEYHINRKSSQLNRAEDNTEDLPQTTSIIIPQPKIQIKPQIESQAQNGKTNHIQNENKKANGASAEKNIMPINNFNANKSQYPQNRIQPQEQYYQTYSSQQNNNYVIKISKQKKTFTPNNDYGLTNMRNLTDLYKKNNAPSIRANQPRYRGPYGNQYGSFY